jgi:hypothetical protein
MTEREKLRQAFQLIGPPKLRFLLEHYPDEFLPNMFGDAVAWLRENEVDNAAACGSSSAVKPPDPTSVQL